MKKRIILLAFYVLLSAAFISTACAQTAYDTAPTSGTCGENLIWELTDGTLIISGTGPMSDFSYDETPWELISDRIQAVVVDSGVTSIGDYAFQSFYYATSIDLPDGLTTIGDLSFNCCIAMTSITIPEGVTSIGYDAFLSARSLQSVWLPSTIEMIGADAFSLCDNLQNVYYAGTRAEAESIYINRGNSALCESTWHCTDGVIFAVTGSIGTCGENLTWVLENGTLIISGTGEMKNYDSSSPAPWIASGDEIHSVIVNSGVTSIGDYAFFDTYLSSTITDVSLPDSLTRIGGVAFHSCPLTDVIIPEGVTNIGFFAFAYCSSLHSVSLPASIEEIQAFAFYRCNTLSDIYYADTRADAESISIGRHSNELILSTWHCADGVFQGIAPIKGNCGKNLTWVLEGETLTISGTGEMDNYTELLPEPWDAHNETIRKVVVDSGVTSIGNYAFYGLNNLTRISLPNGLTWIGRYAFESCEALTEITIPKGVKSIRDGAFKYNSKLQSVSLPSSIETIDSAVFAKCDNLAYVYFVGTQEEAEEIDVGTDNDALMNATWHYLRISLKKD